MFCFPWMRAELSWCSLSLVFWLHDYLLRGVSGLMGFHHSTVAVLVPDKKLDSVEKKFWTLKTIQLFIRDQLCPTEIVVQLYCAAKYR